MDRTDWIALSTMIAGVLIVVASLIVAVATPPAGPRNVPVDFTPDTPPAGKNPGAVA